MIKFRQLRSCIFEGFQTESNTSNFSQTKPNGIKKNQAESNRVKQRQRVKLSKRESKRFQQVQMGWYGIKWVQTYSNGIRNSEMCQSDTFTQKSWGHLHQEFQASLTLTNFQWDFRTHRQSRHQWSPSPISLQLPCKPHHKYRTASNVRYLVRIIRGWWSFCCHDAWYDFGIWSGGPWDSCWQVLFIWLGWVHN